MSSQDAFSFHIFYQTVPGWKTEDPISLVVNEMVITNATYGYSA